MSLNDVFKHFNPVFLAILRSPLHFLLSPGLAIFSVTGRRSGRVYEIPVGYQRDGDAVIVMISQAREKQWWRNYLEGGPATLRLRGRVRSGHARVLAPGSDEFRRAAERTLKRMPWMASQFKLDYAKGSDLSGEQLEQLGVEIAAVRVDLDPA